MATKVTLSGGAFQDLEGNVLANGYLVMKLSQDGNVAGSGNICAGVEIKITLDGTGNVTAGQTVWGNDNILPVNTYYRVTAYSAVGQPVWGPNNQQVTGTSPFNVSGWVPNTVTSWTPPVQPLTLQTNGVSNGFQTLLNLKNGGNVTITDDGLGGVTIAAASGSVVNAGDPPIVSWYGYPFIWNGSVASCWNAAGAATAGAINVVKVFLPYTITVRKFTSCIGQASIGNFWGMAVYDSTGTLLIQGNISSASLGVASVSVGPTVLTSGTYYFAVSCGTTTGVCTTSFTLPNPGGTGGTASIGRMLNQNATRFGVAANVFAANLFPNTLGAITAFTVNGALSFGGFILEP